MTELAGSSHPAQRVAELAEPFANCAKLARTPQDRFDGTYSNWLSVVSTPVPPPVSRDYDVYVLIEVRFFNRRSRFGGHQSDTCRLPPAADALIAHAPLAVGRRIGQAPGSFDDRGAPVIVLVSGVPCGSGNHAGNLRNREPPLRHGEDEREEVCGIGLTVGCASVPHDCECIDFLPIMRGPTLLIGDLVFAVCERLPLQQAQQLQVGSEIVEAPPSVLADIFVA